MSYYGDDSPAAEAVTSYRGEGTHCAEWRRIPATGRQIGYTGILIVRFEGDRIAEYWAQPDLLGLLQQLGAVDLGARTAAHTVGSAGCGVERCRSAPSGAPTIRS